MLIALASVALVLVPLCAAALWLGLQPADPTEHPNTGEYLIAFASTDEAAERLECWAAPVAAETILAAQAHAP